MKLILILFIVIFSINAAFTQAPFIEWQKSLGGTKMDFANSIRQTKDGGYIIAGTSNSNDEDVTINYGINDYWIVKIDNKGNIQWQKSFGGSVNDQPRAVQQTSDGGYIIAGTTNSNDGDITGNHGGNDCWIIRLNNLGQIEWQKVLGGTKNDEANSIHQTKDGGYIIVGTSTSNDGDVTGNHDDDLLIRFGGIGDFWVVKLSNTGNIEWQKSLGGTNGDYGSDIQQTKDGGYIVTGSTQSEDGDVSFNPGLYEYPDFWIAKLSKDGNVEWDKSIGDPTDNDYANSIWQTLDGGYIVAGGSFFRNNLVKLDATGNIEWEKRLEPDNIITVKQNSNGNYIILGTTGSNFLMSSIDNDGSVLWKKTMGGSKAEIAYSFDQTDNGGYIVAGYSASNDGDVSGYHGEGDVWVVKLKDIDFMEDKEIMTYPNPSTGKFTIAYKSLSSEIHLEVYNLFGKRIYQSDNETSFDISHHPNGIYFLKFFNGDKVYHQTIAVRKG